MTKHLFRFVTAALALALAISLGTAPASAQAPFFGGYTVVSGASGAMTAVSTDVALYIKYRGATAGKPTVEVDAATGDITLKIAGAVDASQGCPTVGTGIIDTSDTACDTFVEVLNKINTDGSNWLAAPGSILGADSTNNTMATLAATDAGIRTTGVALLHDTAVTFDANVELVPPGYSGSFWFQGNALNRAPWVGLAIFLQAFREATTFGSGTSTVTVYAVKSTFNERNQYVEAIRTLWIETGGATTVENITDFGAFPLMGSEGERIFVRVDNSAALTAPAVVSSGAILKRQ